MNVRHCRYLVDIRIVKEIFRDSTWLRRLIHYNILKFHVSDGYQVEVPPEYPQERVMGFIRLLNKQCKYYKHTLTGLVQSIDKVFNDISENN